MYGVVGIRCRGHKSLWGLDCPDLRYGYPILKVNNEQLRERDCHGKAASPKLFTDPKSIIFCAFLSLIMLVSQLLYLAPYHFAFDSCAVPFCALTAFTFRFRQSASPRTRITAIRTRTKNTDSGMHVFPKSPLQSTASCIF